MIISVAHQFLPKTSSLHASIVMDHFGVGFETGPHVIADRLELPIQPGDIVLFVGPSGSGKSSLLRAAAAQLDDVLAIDTLPLGDRILVDSFDAPRAANVNLRAGSVSARSLPNAHPTNKSQTPVTDAPGSQTDVRGSPLSETLSLLAACGLGEAQLLLRTPAELSDGQRYRFRLACGFAQKPCWIVADEFTAALDRTLAKVIAFNLRKLATRWGVGCLLATTHADILDDLQPDLLVRCRLDGDPVVTRQIVKKKPSASATNSPSRPDRHATGRISLAGITAAINSPSPAL